MSRPSERDRETLIFGRHIDWEAEATLGTVRFGAADSRPFAAISPTTVEELVENGHLDRDSRHNDAPTAGELIDLAGHLRAEYGDHLSIGIGGFVVGPRRADSRVRLDGFFVGAARPLSQELTEHLLGRFDPELIAAGQTYLEFWWD